VLRIAKLTDYGIVVLAHLARTAHVCVQPAHDIAEATGIPLPTVQKVLKQLAAGELVVGVRGPRGGYQLARDPAEVSVAAVIAVMEGPLSLTDCALHHSGACAEEDHCAVAPHWVAINAAVAQALDAVTVLDVSRPAPPRAVTRGSAAPRPLSGAHEPARDAAPPLAPRTPISQAGGR
jgi:FeS assembly SUF system regulator